MLFSIAAEHHTFFDQNQFIEFEGLLTPSEVDDLRQHLEAAFEKKIGNPSKKIHPFGAGYVAERGSEEGWVVLFEGGVEIWRDVFI